MTHVFRRYACTFIQILAFSLTGLVLKQSVVFAQANPPVTAPASSANPAAPSVLTDLPLQQQTATAVPFTSIPRQDSPLVHVILNGHINATFVVDTGSSDTAITDDLAKKLGAVPHPDPRPSPLKLDGKTAQVIEMSSLQIGDGPADNRVLIKPLTGETVVVSAEQVRKAFTIPLDGIIGMDLLAYGAVSFDFQRHVMTFYHPGALSLAQVHYVGFAAPADVPVPMTLAPIGYSFSVPVVIANGNVSHQVDLMLDTGSNVTYVSRAFAQMLSLTPMQKQRAVTFSKSFDIDYAQVSSLRVVGVTANDFTVHFPDTGDYTTLLGLDFLSGYHVLMDFPGKRIYLAPPATVAPDVHIAPLAPAPPSGANTPTH